MITLVDKRRLDPWLAAADLCLPALCGMELGYSGHFLLIIGFDPAAQVCGWQTGTLTAAASSRGLARRAAARLQRTGCQRGSP